MKKYMIGLSIAAFSLAFTGCSDFLEEPIRGQQDLSEYFKTEDECKQQVTGCYQSLFYDDWWQIQKFYLAGDMCTDDMWMGNTTQDPGEYRDLAHYTGNTYSAGNCCQNFWQYRYKGILRCNVAIDRIPAVEFTDESLRDRYVAEAKFLRAFQYFDLVRNFGGVPLVIGLKLPSEVVGITRATIEQSYEQIERDLKEAIPALPKRSEYAANDLGRVTEGAAQGLLAKVYLYQEKYTEAEKLLQELTCRGEFSGNTPEYKLLKNFGDVWSMDHNNSEESLFEVQTNNDISYNLGERISVVCGSRNDGGWAWGLPTSHLEKAFKDAGDDERRKWTIIKHGEAVQGDPDVDFIMALPDGYETIIGEGGASLSGGEKQRISIARAIMKDAPIIILDEATANVDPESEQELTAAIEALTKEKTILMIAHRLKTVRHADNILVIDGGKIVQSGTHDELMHQGGIYRRFVESRELAVGWKV